MSRNHGRHYLQEAMTLLDNMHYQIQLTLQSSVNFQRLPLAMKEYYVSEMGDRIRHSMNALEFIRLSFDRAVHIAHDRGIINTENYHMNDNRQRIVQEQQVRPALKQTDPAHYAKQEEVDRLRNQVSEMSALISSLAVGEKSRSTATANKKEDIPSHNGRGSAPPRDARLQETPMGQNSPVKPFGFNFGVGQTNEASSPPRNVESPAKPEVSPVHVVPSQPPINRHSSQSNGTSRPLPRPPPKVPESKAESDSRKPPGDSGSRVTLRKAAPIQMPSSKPTPPALVTVQASGPIRQPKDSVPMKNAMPPEASSKSPTAPGMSDGVWKKMQSVKGTIPSSIEDFRIPPCWKYAIVAMTEITEDEMFFQLIEDESLLVTKDPKDKADLSPLREISPGDFVMAHFPEDGDLYRAQTIRLIGSRAEVRFVDYGNRAIVPQHTLREIPIESKSLCQLALRCRLDDSLAAAREKIFAKLESECDEERWGEMFMISFAANYHVSKDGTPTFLICDMQPKGPVSILEVPEKQTLSEGSLVTTTIVKTCSDGSVFVKPSENRPKLQEIEEAISSLPLKKCSAEHAVVGSHILYDELRTQIVAVERSASSSTTRVRLRLLDYGDEIPDVPIDECHLMPLSTRMHGPLGPTKVRLANWQRGSSWDPDRMKQLICGEIEVEMDVIEVNKDGTPVVEFFDCKENKECKMLA